MHAINWSYAFTSDRVWIDCLAALILGAIHVWSYLSNRGKYPDNLADRSAAATSLSSTITGGITAVGILIPVTLIAAQIGHPSQTGLEDIFFADVWFTFSLVFGLYGLFTVGVRGSTENILNRRDVGIVYGLELMTLLIGIVRLLIGIAIVFSGGG